MLKSLCSILVMCRVVAALSDADVYVLDMGKQILHEFPAMSALFGPEIPSRGILGHVVYASPAEACSRVEPAPHDVDNQSRWIALVQRNKCSFADKVLHVQKAGFVAAVVHNIDSDSLLQMRGDTGTITIPSVFIGMTSASILLKYNYSIRHTVILQSANTNYRFLWPFIAVLAICMIAMLIFTMLKCIVSKIHKRMTCLSKSNLKKLPIKKFSKGDMYEMCAICLEEYELGDKLRILACSHAFHQKCIDPWLTRTKPTCPLCKKRVFPRNGDEESDTDTSSIDDSRATATERTPLLPSTPRGTPSEAGAAAVASAVHHSNSWSETFNYLSGSADSSILHSDPGEQPSMLVGNSHPRHQSSVEVHRAANDDDDRLGTMQEENFLRLAALHPVDTTSSGVAIECHCDSPVGDGVSAMHSSFCSISGNVMGLESNTGLSSMEFACLSPVVATVGQPFGVDREEETSQTCTSSRMDQGQSDVLVAADKREHVEPIAIATVGDRVDRVDEIRVLLAVVEPPECDSGNRVSSQRCDDIIHV